MPNLTVDYDVWIDPANVGDHQMWSFGSKAERATRHWLRRADLRVEHGGPPGRRVDAATSTSVQRSACGCSREPGST